MSDSKTFSGVTPAIFSCVKTTSAEQHGTTYDPPNANQGISTTKGTGWIVKLKFEFDPADGDLKYTVVEKSWIVPISAVWNGIGDTINGCRKKAASA
ncbi:hypothetical protein [Ideonella sp.]|uniref:hypothetical protein n=1 Tax=Ideonella sp. TaxID=1929293 RepID=UPI002B490331|nr:hypothetical protein [Ideonella sp.]HJV70261.1 hypothetical protein [Ideonella sp.]